MNNNKIANQIKTKKYQMKKSFDFIHPFKDNLTSRTKQNPNLRMSIVSTKNTQY